VNKSVISVILPFVFITVAISGCALVVKPIATFSTTATEVQPTPTSTPTKTAKPTPTRTPIPEYIGLESVMTNDGVVYIKDGKLKVYDSKTGKAIETDLSQVSFASAVDAKSFVAALYPEYFSNNGQENLLNALIHPGEKIDSRYAAAVKQRIYSPYHDYSDSQPVAIILGEFLNASKVADLENNRDIIVGFLAVYGSLEPIPVQLGWSERNTSNDFNVLAWPQGLHKKSVTLNINTPDEKYTSLEFNSMADIRDHLVGKQIQISLLGKLFSGSDAIIKYASWWKPMKLFLDNVSSG
jgi:hypothetical protein